MPHKTRLLTALVSALMLLLALTPVGYVLYHHWPLRIATVDVQQLVEENQRQTLREIGNGGLEARRHVDERTAEFAAKLSSAIDALGRTCHCVMVNKAALLAGTPLDYTDWVRERIQR